MKLSGNGRFPVAGRRPGSALTIGGSLKPLREVRWLLTALLIFLALQAPLARYVVDDTFIHLTFARNLARGHGFSFNPDHPTYGVSAPLWTLILAALSLLFQPGPGLAKAASTVCGVLTIPAFRLLADRTLLSGRAANLATLVWAANVWLGRWSASGMESPLAVLLLILAFDAQLAGRSWRAGLLTGLALLTRPEAAGLALLFPLDRWREENFRAGLKEIAGSALVVIPWLFYAVSTFGTIVPNPAWIKSDLIFPPLSDIMLGLQRTAAVLAGSNGIEIALILVVGLFVIRSKSLTEHNLRIVVLLAIWALFPAATYLSRGVFVQSRYLLIGLPPLVLGGFAAAEWCAGRMRLRMANLGMALLALLLVAQQVVLTRFVTIPHIRAFLPTIETLVRFAERVRLESPPDALVAVGDVGVIGFYSARRVLDLEGLVSDEVIPYRLGLRLDDFILGGVFLRAGRPDYIIDKALDPRRLEGMWDAEVLEVAAVPGGLVDTADQNWYYTLYRLPLGM